MFHATSLQELQEIRSFGLTAPVAVIALGIDLPGGKPTNEASRGRRKALFLSRLHPKKGLDVLLEVWRNIEQSFRTWELEIVGPLEGSYAKRLKDWVQENEVQRVIFRGELTGERKQQVLSEADLFVLPSYSENFAVVVAEALASEVPVIVTPGTPWTDVQARGCGWCIDPTSEELLAAMRSALLKTDEELREMGRRGRRWVATDFSWEAAAERFVESYMWLLGRCGRPTFVFET
jgi:glycosyltransferase involved in cell wall biosynthesis